MQQNVRMTRSEELWVAACIEAALPGVEVLVHDDGSSNAMYDLDLIRNGRLFAACEVTAAGDARSIELWNLLIGSNERWIEPNLDGGWLLELDPRTRAKALTRRAPDLLRRLEHNPEDQDPTTELKELGVTRAHKSATDFPGSIYVTLNRDASLTGGFVASTGDDILTWFEDWIRGEDQAHNLAKLGAAQYLAERHLFVLLPGFSSAPFSATDLLMRDAAPLPTISPNLPDPLTHVWFMSTWTSGAIFHGGPDGWSSYSKVFDLPR